MVVAIALTFSACGKKDDKIGIGEYEVAGVSIDFTDSVRNDYTGKWRKSLVFTNEDITEYALDYHKTLFSSVDEIHAIINFTLNTTNRLSIISSDVMDISVMEYVNGEEHDANMLFSGMLYKEYNLNVKSGEVTKIQ